MKKLIVFATMLFAAPAFAQDGKMCVQVEGRPCSGQYIQLPQIAEVGEQKKKLTELEARFEQLKDRKSEIRKQLAKATSELVTGLLKKQLENVNKQLTLAQGHVKEALADLKKLKDTVREHEEEIARIKGDVRGLGGVVGNVIKAAEDDRKANDGRFKKNEKRIEEVAEMQRFRWLGLEAQAGAFGISGVSKHGGATLGLRLVFRFPENVNVSFGGAAVKADGSSGLSGDLLLAWQAHEAFSLMAGAGAISLELSSSAADRTYWYGQLGLGVHLWRVTLQGKLLIGTEFVGDNNGPGRSDTAVGAMGNLTVRLF